MTQSIHFKPQLQVKIVGSKINSLALKTYDIFITGVFKIKEELKRWKSSRRLSLLGHSHKIDVLFTLISQTTTEV